MEGYCSGAPTSDICLYDFIINSAGSLLFIVLISFEVSIRTVKATVHIGNNLLILLLLIILSYFTSVSILLFYLPINEVSAAEVVKFQLQILL